MKIKPGLKIFCCLFLPGILYFNLCQGQIISGKVVDVYKELPLSGAQVFMQSTGKNVMTNDTGYFFFPQSTTPLGENIDYEIEILNNKLSWKSNKDVLVSVFNYMGQSVAFNEVLKKGYGEVILPRLSESIYFINFFCNNKRKSFKIWNDKNLLQITQFNKIVEIDYVPDTILIFKEGYYSEKYPVKTHYSKYELLKTSYTDIDYLNKLIRPEAFVTLQSLPLVPVYGEVKSVKLIYSIRDKNLYYTNSAKYGIHYDFATNILGYNKGPQAFSTEQYSDNPNRIYYLASINHFTSSGIYTLEFFPGDDLKCEEIKMVYDQVVESSFIGKNLRFYVNSVKWNSCADVNTISSDDLYMGQNYQPLNPQENYGYLKRIQVNELENTYLGRHDIVLLNGIPLDIPVVAGIITTDFQTPLSHINVLSHNRGTPNMGLRNGWSNPKVVNFLDKLIYFKVTLDSFYIREASLSEAQKFWAKKEPQEPVYLKPDTTTPGLVDLKSAGVTSVNIIGGKAANFAELTKVNVSGYGPLPIPEGVFAIPFYYYWQHIRKYGLDIYIDNMLKDSLFWQDYIYRRNKLEILRDSIKKCQLDTGLLNLVKNKLSETPGFTAFRFRSSTNAEDIVGFNGAGLYDSYTGTTDNPDKPIDKAIKKTWASLWNFQAFEEREYFKIDHRTIAMGVLVNRSFPAEAANGVVITQNIYNPKRTAITINVQVGEISIVKPTDKFLPDQIIYYTNDYEYVNHSNVPGMEGKNVMTNEELKVLRDYCMAIHYHYCRLNFECHPMDIEFKVDIVNGERKIYIKQARRY